MERCQTSGVYHSHALRYGLTSNHTIQKVITLMKRLSYLLLVLTLLCLAIPLPAKSWGGGALGQSYRQWQATRGSQPPNSCDYGKCVKPVTPIQPLPPLQKQPSSTYKQPENNVFGRQNNQNQRSPKDCLHNKCGQDKFQASPRPNSNGAKPPPESLRLKMQQPVFGLQGELPSSSQQGFKGANPPPKSVQFRTHQVFGLQGDSWLERYLTHSIYKVYTFVTL